MDARRTVPGYYKVERDGTIQRIPDHNVFGGLQLHVNPNADGSIPCSRTEEIVHYQRNPRTALAAQYRPAGAWSDEGRGGNRAQQVSGTAARALSGIPPVPGHAGPATELDGKTAEHVHPGAHPRGHLRHPLAATGGRLTRRVLVAEGMVPHKREPMVPSSAAPSSVAPNDLQFGPDDAYGIGTLPGQHHYAISPQLSDGVEQGPSDMFSWS